MEQLNSDDTITSPCIRGYTSPKESNSEPPVMYTKITADKSIYLAYVVTIKDPINLHLDIYWPETIKEKYISAIRYEYSFIGEETLEEGIITRTVYSCHLRDIEINPGFANMKEASIIVSKMINESNGWVLVNVSDVDIYKRILINLFHVHTRSSINKELLIKVNPLTNTPIARRYIKHIRNKHLFKPKEGTVPEYYVATVTSEID